MQWCVLQKEALLGALLDERGDDDGCSWLGLRPPLEVLVSLDDPS
jgi:hypothetical protein